MMQPFVIEKGFKLQMMWRNGKKSLPTKTNLYFDQDLVKE